MGSLKQVFARSSLLKNLNGLRNVCALNDDGQRIGWTTNNSIRVSTHYSTITNGALIGVNKLSIQSMDGSLGRFYSKNKSSKYQREYASDSDSDSDSDGEHKKKLRGDSEFWRRKMRTFHNLLDVNNDGVISYDDFQMLAKNFASLGHLTPTAQEEFNEVLKTTWETQWGEITPYNLINAEQYLTEMQHAINDKDQRDRIHTFLPFLFKAVDKDHSGFISLAEYKLFFKCLGLTPENAAVSFAIIDKNGDGKISIKEFVKLGREFFLTEDERRVSRMFWGPLANEH